MTRALVVLTVGSFLTLVVEATVADQPLLAITLAAAFAALAIVGYGWIDRQPPHRRPALGMAYVAVQLPLGYLMFGASVAGVGSTLLLMVLVSQSVLLLPLPGAVVVTGAVPLVHVGMSWSDGLRNAMGILAAAALTAVVNELLRR
ncbi:MAG: integral rane sensor signal transduction histidine kinase [Blastococcus sp.]|nr:integral rane sensor signal transduction histidine kinase [Blastococcus sp.]